jgi:hypothetical protein
MTLATDQTLSCPKCGHAIKLTESLAAPLVAATRAEYEDRLAIQTWMVTNVTTRSHCTLHAKVNYSKTRLLGHTSLTHANDCMPIQKTFSRSFLKSPAHTLHNEGHAGA